MATKLRNVVIFDSDGKELKQDVDESTQPERVDRLVGQAQLWLEENKDAIHLDNDGYVRWNDDEDLEDDYVYRNNDEFDDEDINEEDEDEDIDWIDDDDDEYEEDEDLNEDEEIRDEEAVGLDSQLLPPPLTISLHTTSLKPKDLLHLFDEGGLHSLTGVLGFELELRGVNSSETDLNIFSVCRTLTSNRSKTKLVQASANFKPGFQSFLLNGKHLNTFSIIVDDDYGQLGCILSDCSLINIDYETTPDNRLVERLTFSIGCLTPWFVLS